MEHIVLLLFSFFTEAVILWQYTSNLFTSSYGSKIGLALLSALYTILFLLSLLKQTGLNVVSFFVFDMYPEFWTHIYKLGGHHGCFSVFYRRHPFCFCLDSFAIIVINIFINSNCKFFK